MATACDTENRMSEQNRFKKSTGTYRQDARMSVMQGLSIIQCRVNVPIYNCTCGLQVKSRVHFGKMLWHEESTVCH